MLLTVLSVLARRDVDPWREAAKLAQLPVRKATDQLASVIAALPEGPSARPDPAAMAARLIALLPRWTAGSKAQPRAPSVPGVGGTTRSRAIIFVVAVVLVLGAQYFFQASRTPAEPDNGRAPFSDTVSPPTVPRP